MQLFHNRLLPALLLVSSVMLTSACVTTQQARANKEDSLAAAGFVDRPANTPARQAMLAKLPAGKFVRRVHGDDVRYVYADPVNCNCLYVGNQQAYSTYQQQRQSQHIADEQQETAAEYSDPAWDWGAWGGFGRGFGWGPGFGW